MKSNNCRVVSKQGRSFDIEDIFLYLTTGRFPDFVFNAYQKSNFRRGCRSYVAHNNKLFFKKINKTTEEEVLLEVVRDEENVRKIIGMAHEGSATSLEASGLSGHRGML